MKLLQVQWHIYRIAWRKHSGYLNQKSIKNTLSSHHTRDNGAARPRCLRNGLEC